MRSTRHRVRRTRAALVVAVLGALSALSPGCAEHHPIHPGWTLQRGEGHWVVASTEALRAVDAPPPFTRIDIEGIEGMPFEDGGGWVGGKQYATGTVRLSGQDHPAAFFLGTPNNPRIPYVWVVPEAVGSADAPSGFAIRLEVLGDVEDVASTDPADDWLYVAVDDSTLEVGDNYAERLVKFVRAR